MVLSSVISDFIEDKWKKSKRLMVQHHTLFISIAAFCIIYLSYTIGRSYPGGGAGLYLVWTESLAQNDFVLPRTVDFYADSPLVFAFPPLAFYLFSIFNEFTNISYISLAIYYPGIMLMFSMIPLYLFSLNLLESKNQAALATFLFTSSPWTLSRYLTADGFVSTTGLFFLFTGFLFGYYIFVYSDYRYVGPSLVLFGLVLLTHPTEASNFGMVFLILYLYFDRSKRGLICGAVVAIGGVLVASPWWFTVISYHGFEPFVNVYEFATSSSTSSIIWDSVMFYLSFDISSIYTLNIMAWVVPAIGIFYLFSKERYFLIFWTFTTIIAGGHLYLIMCLISSITLIEFIYQSLSNQNVSYIPIAHIFLIVVVTSSLFLGVGYAALKPPAFDEDDVSAASWARENTREEASFAILSSGFTNDWFPFLSNRTVIVGTGGQEWKEKGVKNYNRRFRNELISCSRAKCLTRAFDNYGQSPDYVYVENKNFNESTFETESDYIVVYNRSGITIANYTSKTLR